MSGTNGAPSGMSGWRARMAGADRRDLILGWTLILGITAAFMVVNSLTVLTDSPSLRLWAPWVWEGTSALSLALLIWLPWLAASAAPTALLDDGWRGRGAFLALHLTAALLYSLLHVGLMVAMRHGVYAALGEAYDYGPPIQRFVYEFRKDLLSYTLFVGVFWAVRSLREARESPMRPVSFDIRDGARLIRAPLDDILAVTSAGNYVEFILADGRRPLMRATLAAVEVELERCGFVRTHRSWLVNAARMSGLRPEGSGDWTVELGSLEAPLSRRYAPALDRLKAERPGPVA
ncbi:MAG: LytTR family DNA-binding domain-containing protein [Candidatus Brevundimonas phytovorans]|nr:LytTR family DNA-binding domain-containing protein [Brevundimonas sp.]WEK58334.1 MAG: LytTR family DNA-binding domain-containing protein [Brevundimonas sp.]